MGDAIPPDGTQRTLGKITGELTAMTRELAALRAELAELRPRLDEVATQLRIHLTHHRVEEQYRREIEENRRFHLTEQRWYQQWAVQLGAAILGSSAVGAVVSQLLRGHG